MLPCAQVWADVYTLPVPGCDGKTAAEIFDDAGCVKPAAPSCAACLGGPRDTFARMNEPEVCVSTTNRNFPGAHTSPRPRGGGLTRSALQVHFTDVELMHPSCLDLMIHCWPLSKAASFASKVVDALYLT